MSMYKMAVGILCNNIHVSSSWNCHCCFRVNFFHVFIYTVAHLCFFRRLSYPPFCSPTNLPPSLAYTAAHVTGRLLRRRGTHSSHIHRGMPYSQRPGWWITWSILLVSYINLMHVQLFIVQYILGCCEFILNEWMLFLVIILRGHIYKLFSL